MIILVTGSQGFIAKNLITQLRNRGYSDILECDKGIERTVLEQYAAKCDFVFHLAGINRTDDEKNFMEGNAGFTAELLDVLKRSNSHAPVLVSSSIQAEQKNSYGESKKACEDMIFTHGRKYGIKTYVYRLPNVFGKWCRPNYNSVVATFCHNIAHGLSIEINGTDKVLHLAYIDDVANEFIAALENRENRCGDGFCRVEPNHEITLGELAHKLYAFKANRDTLVMPSLANDLDRELYAVLLSYLPANGFDYGLEMKTDNRGWLAEFMKSEITGQIFISRTRPGVSRGNHWHQTKAEKFLVIQGKAVVSLRSIQNDKKIEYKVNGENLRVIDIPVGYTHAITNVGTDDLITLFWSDEVFNSAKPDTFYEPVRQKGEHIGG